MVPGCARILDGFLEEATWQQLVRPAKPNFVQMIDGVWQPLPDAMHHVVVAPGGFVYASLLDHLTKVGDVAAGDVDLTAALG